MKKRKQRFCRLSNQNRRINKELKEGEITKQQANQLHHEDHAIRQEERTMAKFNNGHITKGEQKTLNQQENAVSGQIGRKALMISLVERPLRRTLQNVKSARITLNCA